MDSLVWLELDKLRDEIGDLKSCQVNYVKFAALLYGVTISAAGAYRGLRDTAATAVGPLDMIVYAFFLSIVVLVFPSIMLIIIHKCRSIFRIVAYIRFVEQNMMRAQEQNKTVVFYGYERLHRKLKEHPWLQMRVLPYRSIRRIFKELAGYRYWSLKMTAEKTNLPVAISVDGRSSVGDYIGDYYGKLLFFLKLLFAVAWIPQLLLLVYAGRLLDGHLRWLAWGAAAASVFWWLYYHLITSRYTMELRYRPFSIDAYYDMWQWAAMDPLYGPRLLPVGVENAGETSLSASGIARRMGV